MNNAPMYALRVVAPIVLALATVPGAYAARPIPGRAAPPPGSLVQLPGSTGCITTNGLSGCAQSPLFKGAWDVKVSPDGLNVYVAARYSNAVVAFRRDPTDGSLTLLPGTATCVSSDGSGGFCAKGRDLYQPVSLAFSSDGRFLLVASRLSNGIAIFKRDLSQGPLHGQLSQAAGTAGCINSGGAKGCASPAYTAIDRARAIVAIGPYVYVASQTGGLVAVFAQDQATGELAQLPLPYGCIATSGGVFGVCTKAHAVPAPVALTVVPTGAARAMLLVGSSLRISSCTPEIPYCDSADKYVGSLDEIPLLNDLPTPENNFPCFTAGDPGPDSYVDFPGCSGGFDALVGTISITAGPYDGSIFVGTWPPSDYAPSFYEFESGSGGYTYAASPTQASVSAGYQDHVYTPTSVLCAGIVETDGGAHFGYSPCAPVLVGKPHVPSGATNVLPTAMAITADGENVYLTYGTPAGHPTKLGGIYALHPVR